jgi:hypothetical protein
VTGTGPVSYRPRGFRDTKASIVDLDDFRDQDVFQETGRFVLEHQEELFYVKTLDWASEHEFRVTFLGEPRAADHIHVPFSDAIEAVIVGELSPTGRCQQRTPRASRPASSCSSCFGVAGSRGRWSPFRDLTTCPRGRVTTNPRSAR